MEQKIKTTIAAICVLSGAFVFCSTIVGIIATYSPVPYWDQWDSYIGFYSDILGGHGMKLWDQHNEHRIVLSRALFFLDLRFFEGTGIFLLSAQVGIQALLLIVMVKLGLPSAIPSRLRYAVVGCVAALLFSWRQAENFTWAFQIGFFLVYFFAFLSFYFLATSKANRFTLPTILALICGCLATLSMANGLLVLPMLFVLGLILRIKWQILVVILITAVVVWSGYFFDYFRPLGHASIIDSIINQPFDVVLFTLSYLGAPLAYAFENRSLAIPGGLFLAVMTLWYMWDEIKNPILNQIYWVFLAFLVFLAATAFITATGRVNFGIDAAFAGRYATPALLAWSALAFIAMLKYKENCFRSIAVVLTVCIISLMLTTHQYEIVKKSISESIKSNYQRDIAILGATIGVYDETYTSKLFPDYNRFKTTAKEAAKYQISVFSPAYYESKIGKRINTSVIRSMPCEGHLDIAAVVNSDAPAVRVSGWAFDVFSGSEISKIIFTNTDGLVVGEALPGRERPDVAVAVPGATMFSGWDGYILLDQVSDSAEAYGEIVDGYCKINNSYFEREDNGVVVKRYDYSDSMESIEELVILSSAWSSSLLPGGSASSDDFQYLSSWVGADSFTGETKLTLKSNDNGLLRFCYTTGPVSDRQLIRIYEGGKLIFTNSVFLSENRWSIYEINVEPSKEYGLSIIDSGNGWGEWIALGCL
jgi:hypothetical protein